MARQLRLRLQRAPSYERSEFAVGPSNASAVETVDRWPAWPGGALALIGPAGVGKTHLAQAWRARAEAVELPPRSTDVGPAGPVLIEDLDRGFDAELLFHRINMAAREGGGLLVTARTPPSAWTTDLPDLRSRLNALTVAEIEPPDDRVLEVLLRRLFAQRNIAPQEDVVPYLLRRIERSAAAAQDVVRRLDAASGEDHRPVSRVLARHILENDTENLDLFD
ncbi:MAG: chromosomal replication initiator DnaA [Phenylobacterium sp.]|uniref:DnaA ATPase domain-containing protein n=1 Tax=Phenylobacterium sp. TaxID=1871053 RepID=UPI0018410E28|nr:DnaA/Hda family protein [Phenylobacterium sp.]MBA4792810.1 chromosomal replication initiator DnaA [Phenylobacterium sp.]